MAVRFRARRGQLETLEGLLPDSQGQNLALTVLYMPYSLDSGTRTGQAAGGKAEVLAVGRLKVCPAPYREHVLVCTKTSTLNPKP